MPLLHRSKDLDHCFSGVVLQRTVLLVVGGHGFGCPTRARGQDFEEIGNAGLGRAVESNVGVGVGDGALELLHDDCRFVEEVDDSGVPRTRLRHLGRRVLEVGDLGSGLRGDHSRDDERLAEAGVEAFGDVAGDLDVLALILADGNVVGVVEQDVGCLESGIGEQSGRDEVGLALGRLVLELGHSAEFSVGDGAFHDPTQLGVLGNVALHEDGGDIGVETHGEKGRSQFESALADDPGPVGDRQSVEIDDAVERVAFVLARDPVPQSTQIVPEMDRTSGLDARQDTRHLVEASGRHEGRPAEYARPD